MNQANFEQAYNEGYADGIRIGRLHRCTEHHHWVMVRHARVSKRVVCDDAERVRLLRDPEWHTDYRIEGSGEAMTCEHGHPACGIGSTLCGDDHAL
jgi:hypothetical protein